MTEKPTPLGAFLECLHILEALPEPDRHRVIDALATFKAFNPKVLGAVTTNEPAQAGEGSGE